MSRIREKGLIGKVDGSEMKERKKVSPYVNLLTRKSFLFSIKM